MIGHTLNPSEFREGAIYRWDYREVDYSTNRSPYHCKSQIAVATNNGRFRDTYWCGACDGFYFGPEDLDKIKITFVANFDELVEAGYYKADYYVASDIVDLRHSNSSSGNFYLRKGARRDKAKMLAAAEYRIERAQSEIRSAEWSIERARAAIALIELGELDEVSL